MSDNTEFLHTNHETIIVVEDEVLVRTAIAEYLRHCGFRVVEAASADEALIVLSETDIQIDIVFSDIKMPGSMDGFGLAKWVRENKCGLQVILTGNIEKAAQAAGEICEHGPHLEKPYEPQQVVEWIRRLRASTLKGE
jgi:CheY-like chemotaxis protein